MQLNVLFTAAILSLSIITTADAQQKYTPKSKKQAANIDTCQSVRMISPKAGASLLADNIQLTAAQEKLGYGHVPLAGEKSYYGDKSTFVNDFVRKYMEVNNRTLSSVQSNSEKPFSVIDNILEQKKMPKELKYLAVIESALNHNAVSHAGAVGPWQMMEATAKMMGLAVTRKNDERKDWAKSTAAATKYLDLLYSQLNDWLLVIAAYNSGPTPVQKAIDKTGSHNFWDIKEYLPQETQGHVLAFIATASIFENLSKFINIGSIPVDFKFSKDKEDEAFVKEMAAAVSKAAASANAVATPTATSTVAAVVVPKLPSFTDDELKNMSLLKLDKAIPLEVIEYETGIDKKLLTRWNPDYNLFLNHTYATTFYKIRLPKDKIDLFLQKKEAMVKLTKQHEINK
jgi:membrane-bound lytic murein transglycosylase D